MSEIKSVKVQKGGEKSVYSGKRSSIQYGIKPEDMIIVSGAVTERHRCRFPAGLLINILMGGKESKYRARMLMNKGHTFASKACRSVNQGGTKVSLGDGERNQEEKKGDLTEWYRHLSSGM